MRLISTINRSLGFKAKVYRNSEYDEFVVKFYDESGVLIPNSEYYTDCKIDAINTAHFELDRMVNNCMV